MSGSKKQNVKSEAVKALEKLAFEDLKKRFPQFPYPIAQKYTDSDTNGLTRCVIDYITLRGFQAERINSMGQQISVNGTAKWVKGSTQNGTADISATIKGRSVKIEIKCKKTGDHFQSDEQKEYQRQIQQAGGIYKIVRTFEDFYTWFNRKI